MKYLVLILVLVSLAACEVKLREFDKPKNLIPEDTMALVLEDVMVMEYHIQSRYPLPEQFQEILKKSGDTILASHHVTFERFDESMSYYASKQAEMQAIYDKVLEKLTNKLNRMPQQVVR